MKHQESHGPYDIPPLIRDALLAYKFTGRPTGAFCRAVIENDLTGAVGRADPESFAAIKEICRWVYWELPQSSTGKGTYKKWVASGGLEGKAKKAVTP